MRMKNSILCSVVVMLVLGLAVTATADPYTETVFTENYGNFATNNAGGYAYVWKTGQATMTGAPSPLPAPMYLKDWTYALSSSGYGCSDGMYLGVLEYDGTGWGDVVGISSTYVDMASEFAAWEAEEGNNPEFGQTWYTGFRTVTWQFDYVPLQPDTLYAMTFLQQDAETGDFYIAYGGIELDTSDSFEGGFINGGNTINQPAWEAHYVATYSDVTPYPANTAPVDGAVNQAPDVQLSWTAPSAYTSEGYNVYIDPYEPNLTAAEADYYIPAQAGTTYTPSPALEQDKTYYWRVEALEPNAVAPYGPISYSGPVWEFTTAPPSVVIEGDPVSQTVEAGGTVELSVAALNVETYQWYKDGVPITGATDATLTLTDVQLVDEGSYTCTVSNSLPSEATSAPALVMTKRLAGWWKLDGDLADSVATVVAGAPTHDGTCTDPNFVGVGKDNGAMAFFGDAAGLVKIADSNDFFNFYPQGLTVSAWVNMPEKSVYDPWGAFVCKQGFDPSRGFILTNSNIGDAIFTMRQSFGDLYSGFSADTDSWRLVTGTYEFDPDTGGGIGKIYFDGTLRNQATSTGIPQPADAPLIFGAENLDATTAPYSGLLDDVRIWTYPLDAYEVAELYTDFNPGSSVCVEYPELDITGPNGERDCKVNLYDFADIAAEWLNCGRYPESECN